MVQRFGKPFAVKYSHWMSHYAIVFDIVVMQKQPARLLVRVWHQAGKLSLSVRTNSIE
jgi:hypothetical protein